MVVASLRYAVTCNGCFLYAFECNPHSFAPSFSHHHLPARKSSPGFIALVQGSQPMLT
jgi:hypothetical protein